MNNYKKALIENGLIKAIMAFHDCNEKNKNLEEDDERI